MKKFVTVCVMLACVFALSACAVVPGMSEGSFGSEGSSFSSDSTGSSVLADEKAAAQVLSGLVGFWNKADSSDFFEISEKDGTYYYRAAFYYSDGFRGYGEITAPILQSEEILHFVADFPAEEDEMVSFEQLQAELSLDVSKAESERVVLLKSETSGWLKYVYAGTTLDDGLAEYDSRNA